MNWIHLFVQVPNYSKLALVQAMAWHQTVAKALSEALMSQFTDAYLSHQGLIINPLRAKLFRVFAFYVIPPHWFGTGT